MTGKKGLNVCGLYYHKKYKTKKLIKKVSQSSIYAGIIDKMYVKNKTIRDPIHGDIKFEDVFLELIEAPEIQRLYNIKQLGFAHLVFPGAHHTRLEHSFGSYHLATKVGDILNLKKDERKLVPDPRPLLD